MSKTLVSAIFSISLIGTEWKPPGLSLLFAEIFVVHCVCSLSFWLHCVVQQLRIVGNHLLSAYPGCAGRATAAAKSLQSCPTLCDPIDGSPPGSSIHGILQARVLEWVAIAFYWYFLLLYLEISFIPFFFLLLLLIRSGKFSGSLKSRILSCLICAILTQCSTCNKIS